jgi:hypothetical protein
MDLLEQAFEGKQITDSSKRLYLANLKRLNNNEIPKNFKFLNNLEEIQEKIGKYKPNTRRSYIISIVSLLKVLKEKQKKYKKLYDDYYVILEQLNNELKDQTTKTDKENTNWISQTEIKELLDEKMEILESVKNLKKVNEEQYNDLLDLVILALFVLQKPRRNRDYQLMKVVKKHKDEYGTDSNFLCLNSNTFIFNNYKTAKTYSTQTQPIDEKMREIINVYMKFHPLKNRLKETNNTTTPFLVKFDGEPLLTDNSLTRRLYKIFGKKIGSSMLRKLYLTDKYGDKMSEVKEIMDEMNSDTSAMGTSNNTALNNYIKKNENS